MDFTFKIDTMFTIFLNLKVQYIIFLYKIVRRMSVDIAE